MAKVTDITFEIKGIKHVVNVNIKSDGFFTAYLPDNIASALNLEKKLEYTTLNALEKDFLASIERYKKSQTSQELFILIKYQASGRFSENIDGTDMHRGHNGKYKLNVSGIHSDCIGGLGFQFKVCIKETIDSVENWYDTLLGKNHPHWDKEQQSNPDKYYKDTKIFRVDDWKKIPYSPEALQTLKNGEEVIRKASEILFNFIEQDEKQIETLLTNGKLLN